MPGPNFSSAIDNFPVYARSVVNKFYCTRLSIAFSFEKIKQMTNGAISVEKTSMQYRCDFWSKRPHAIND